MMTTLSPYEAYHQRQIEKERQKELAADQKERKHVVYTVYSHEMYSAHLQCISDLQS